MDGMGWLSWVIGLLRVFKVFEIMILDGGSFQRSDLHHRALSVSVPEGG